MHMKKSLLALSVLVFVATSASAASIGVVDLEVIKNEYVKAKDNDKNLKAAFENAKAEMQSRVEKLKKLQAEAELADKAAKDPMIKDDARAGKQAEAKQKAEEFFKEQGAARQFEQQTGQYFQQRAQQVDREIMIDVKTQSEAVAKERKIDLIVPKGLVLTSDASLDVSAAVVKRLNEAHAANQLNPTAMAPVAGTVTATPAAAAAQPSTAK